MRKFKFFFLIIQVLLPLLADASKIPQLQFVLVNSNVPHAIVFAAQALIKLITGNWAAVSTVQKEEMKQFVFNFLGNQGPDL